MAVHKKDVDCDIFTRRWQSLLLSVQEEVNEGGAVLNLVVLADCLYVFL